MPDELPNALSTSVVEHNGFLFLFSHGFLTYFQHICPKYYVFNNNISLIRVTDRNHSNNPTLRSFVDSCGRLLYNLNTYNCT